jgi:hypothetical protein
LFTTPTNGCRSTCTRTAENIQAYFRKISLKFGGWRRRLVEFHSMTSSRILPAETLERSEMLRRDS